MKKLLLIVALSLFLAGCGEAVAPVATPSPTAMPTAPLPTATIALVPTAIPTATFTPFPTPMPTAIVPTQPPNVPAVLGSPIQAFFDKFGQPNEAQFPYTWNAVPGTGDRLVAYTYSIPPLERVASILLGAPKAVWTEQDALTHCAPYFPLDAKRGQRYNLQAGYTVVYTSASLGKVFLPQTLRMIKVTRYSQEPLMCNISILAQTGQTPITVISRLGHRTSQDDSLVSVGCAAGFVLLCCAYLIVRRLDNSNVEPGPLAVPAQRAVLL